MPAHGLPTAARRPRNRDGLLIPSYLWLLGGTSHGGRRVLVGKTGFRQRLRSWFDGTMDRGTPALIGWLGLASLVLITVVTALVMALTPEGNDKGAPEILWESLLRAMDPGTIGADSGSHAFLALILAATAAGIFTASPPAAV